MQAITTLATTTADRPMTRFEFSAEQRKMIRDSFANGASDAEFAVLMEVAKVRGLNPLTRQIYFVKRWDSQKRCEVWSTQISIDGLRAVAERTGVYDGQGEPVYEYDKDGKLTKCTVHVYRKDWSAGRSAVGVAFFSEYAQTKKDGGLTSFWATKPHIMLAKCAEALAIRKAFPEDTSGLYVPEEMGEAAAVTVEAEVVHPPEADKREAPRQEAPKAVEAPRKFAPPVHVVALWNRLVKAQGGNKKLAEIALAKAATDAGVPKHSAEWTPEHVSLVEAELWPADVP